MNLYMTSGTPEFMQSIKKKYPNEELFLLHGTGNSVLIHETSSKPFFKFLETMKYWNQLVNSPTKVTSFYNIYPFQTKGNLYSSINIQI